MRQPAMRAEKIERIRAMLTNRQAASIKHLGAVLNGNHPDATAPWKEVTGQTRVALIFAQGAMAAQRAETMADAPKALGVIVVSGRLPDTEQNRLSWEEKAARLNARAIEAVPVKEPNGNP